MVAGALAGAVMSVSLTHTRPGPAFWICLASAVWLIYTADHLLDGLKNKEKSGNPRYRFHYRHRKVIIAVMVAVALCSAYIAIRSLPHEIILFGSGLGLFSLLYLALNWISIAYRIKYLGKEFIIAIIYVAGVWGGPLVMAGGVPASASLVAMAIYLLMAIVNLLTLSCSDSGQDQEEGQPSFTVYYGKAFTYRWIYILSLGSMMLSIIALFIFEDKLYKATFAILLVMSLLQALIIYNQRYTRRRWLLRQLGELIFWIPSFILLV